MRITRFYCPETLIVNRIIELPDAVHRHAVRVLRLQIGDPLILFDGNGGEFDTRLVSVSKRSAQVEIIAHRESESESLLDITLGQALAKGERMDFAIQKAVELGVARLSPVITERSSKAPDTARLSNRMQHWQSVITSSCEQCQRNRLPGLDQPQPLLDWLAHAGDGLKLVLDPTASGGLDQHNPTDKITLLVGPEGGLSDLEIVQAKQAGFSPVKLGPRVLRTETAGLAALAILQNRWGDLN